MPELPEVETTRRGLAAHLTGLGIADVVIRNTSLRWPIPKSLPKLLRAQTIRSLKRRAKYLLMDCGNGTLILHLGMSGSLRIQPVGTTGSAGRFIGLQFQLPGSADVITASGEVVSSSSSDGPVGVRFTRLPTISKERIGHYLAKRRPQ